MDQSKILDVVKLAVVESVKETVHLVGHLSKEKMGMEMIVAALPGWEPKNIVWDLGMLLEEGLLMVDHINSICKSSFYQLHQIVVIQQNLIHDSILTFIHTFAMTCLD